MIKEFFTDPFGIRRITELRAQVCKLLSVNRAQAEYVDDLRDEVGALRKVINDMMRHEKP
jgi:hypothetical protein